MKSSGNTLFDSTSPTKQSREAKRLTSGIYDTQLADVTLRYRVIGTGPVLFVMCPGWGPGSSLYRSTFGMLHRYFTVVYVEPRGNGGSTQPADPEQMSSTVLADDLDRLRDDLGLETISLFSHSNGGTIALEYAIKYGNHVANLVLCYAQVLGGGQPNATQRYFQLWKDDPAYRDAVNEATKIFSDDSFITTSTQFEQAATIMAPLYFSKPALYVPVFLEAIRDSDLSVFALHTHANADRKSGRNQTLGYGLIRARTLIFQGTVDCLCPVEIAENMHRGIKGSQLLLFANVGHIPWIEAGERFFDEMICFLNQHS